jgi:(2Fe-2S) ferredoxin
MQGDVPDDAEFQRKTGGYFRIHVFCCTNVRPEGHPRGSCKQRGAEPLRNYLKARAKELGVANVRINAAGCLDRCELGPTMVVYPEGVWYHYRTMADAEEILQEHIIGGRIVERLVLRDDQTELDDASVS